MPPPGSSVTSLCNGGIHMSNRHLVGKIQLADSQPTTRKTQTGCEKVAKEVEPGKSSDNHYRTRAHGIIGKERFAGTGKEGDFCGSYARLCSILLFTVIPSLWPLVNAGKWEPPCKSSKMINFNTR